VEFTDAGMKFSLTFWLADPDGMDNVKSEVMLSLWEAFKREGIRVPYPVREIRVRGGALPVETRGSFERMTGARPGAGLLLAPPSLR
jgi:small-conductance mechanosensitive channel